MIRETYTVTDPGPRAIVATLAMPRATAYAQFAARLGAIEGDQVAMTGAMLDLLSDCLVSITAAGETAAPASATEARALLDDLGLPAVSRLFTAAMARMAPDEETEGK
jgi:hypothetical protein